MKHGIYTYLRQKKSTVSLTIGKKLIFNISFLSNGEGFVCTADDILTQCSYGVCGQRLAELFDSGLALLVNIHLSVECDYLGDSFHNQDLGSVFS